MRILVGITGGIAAYKTVSLIRLLTEAGHEVKVLPTTNALRFVGSATLEAISHNSVDPDLYSDVEQVKHIKLAQETDLVIIAPATAAFIARYAIGLADDLLLNVLLATKARVLIAPAMHTEMWQHEATMANIRTLESRGVSILQPGVGRLTGSDTGVGRMMEPEEIFTHVAPTKGSLHGKRVLVAAGGTQEPIDDVRFIGNRSSGKQGVALAQEALNRGAHVTFIDCNVTVPLPAGLVRVQASTVDELESALREHASNVDVVFMPVAVSDFKVKSPVTGKLSREDGKELSIDLVSTPDLLTGLARSRNQENKPLLVGFAAEVVANETELESRAQAKYARKGVELLVANNVAGGKVFAEDETEVVIVSKSASRISNGSKALVAQVILDEVEHLLRTDHVA